MPHGKDSAAVGRPRAVTALKKLDPICRRGSPLASSIRRSSWRCGWAWHPKHAEQKVRGLDRFADGSARASGCWCSARTRTWPKPRRRGLTTRAGRNWPTDQGGPAGVRRRHRHPRHDGSGRPAGKLLGPWATLTALSHRLATVTAGCRPSSSGKYKAGKAGIQSADDAGSIDCGVGKLSSARTSRTQSQH